MTVAVACLLAACNSGTVTGPDPVETVAQAPEPVAAATPAPQPVAGGPTTAFELSCGSGSTLSVKYNGPASRATIETFYTSFDNQDLVFGKQSHTVNAGDSVTRTFDVCQQADADQPGVKLIGGCFFDKRGEPFNPTKSPEKVAECRCVPTWKRAEKYETIYGEWVTAQDACSKTRTVTYRYTETQSCTNATRTVDEKQKDQREGLHKYETRSFVVVNDLSHTGNDYRIRASSNSWVTLFDPTVIGPLSLAAGQTYEEQYPANNKYLGLFHGSEKLDTVRAQCQGGPAAAWKGNIDFQCRQVDVCSN